MERVSDLTLIDCDGDSGDSTRDSTRKGCPTSEHGG